VSTTTPVELAAACDDRTLEILGRRRSSVLINRRGWLVRRALLAADVIGIFTAFALVAFVFEFVGTAEGSFSTAAELLLLTASLPVWVVVAKLYGLYDRDEERTDHTTVDDVVGVFHLVTVGTWLVYLVAALTPIAQPDLGRAAVFWGSAIVSITVLRAVARSLCRRHIAYLQNTIIVGAGDVGQLIAKKLLQHPEYGINLVGFVDAEPKQLRPGVAHLALLGGPERLPELVRLLDIERVVIAFSNASHDETLELVRGLGPFAVQIDIVPRLFELVGPGIDVHTVEGMALLGLRPAGLSRSSRLLKRTFDLIVGGLTLLLATPLLVLAALAVLVDSGRPVLFSQMRMGMDNRPFRIWKLRTMVRDADARKKELAHLNHYARDGGDARMFKIADDPRVTRVGRLLRRFSIDELPQLVNVVRGEMSLVGPRPLILAEDRLVEDWARRRLDLKPGMTGLWQVLGRNGIPFDEMVGLDYRYVTTWSLWNDVRLLARTLPSVLRSGQVV
jgi:exopolysaccharide biosynthesis polyprenyl glycosylphosphotransferase